MSTWKVSPSEQGMKLIDFIRQHIESECSLRQIKRWIEGNLCTINGKTERFASTLVIAGDAIELATSHTDAPTTKKRPSDTHSVLYQDADLLIYNKPAGIACTDSVFLKSLEPICRGLLLIHRLDKGTSGALMLAKNERTRLAMIEQFKKKKVLKKYFALVDGVVRNEKGVMESYLGKLAAFQGQSVWGSVTKDQGIHAETRWRIFQRGREATLLECVPVTGRTHQIRVHLSEMGHPILGDYQYGKKFVSSYRPHRSFLHAFSLSFEHPFTLTPIYVEAPLPHDFKEGIDKLCPSF